MAERSRVPFWKQASHFEAAQVNEYRGQVFKTTLDAGMQMTMRDPWAGVRASSVRCQRRVGQARKRYTAQVPSQTLPAAIKSICRP